MRYLGLDVGERRIGVAVSDPGGALATPLTYLVRSGQERDVARVLELAAQRGAEALVVGLPYTMAGEVGPQARRVLAFVEALRAQSSLPVETWDERLSTADAEAMLRAAGRRPSRDKGYADAAAAAVILQSYLDARRQGRGPA